MIDALISDIQNPGNTAKLPDFRVADFSPSKSPDSFAAYLERISGSPASWSADERSAADTDSHAAKRDVQRNISNGEDKAAHKDTQKAVGESENTRPAGAAEKRTESSPQSQNQAKSQDASADAASKDGLERGAEKAENGTADKAAQSAQENGKKIKGMKRKSKKTVILTPPKKLKKLMKIQPRIRQKTVRLRLQATRKIRSEPRSRRR